MPEIFLEFDIQQATPRIRHIKWGNLNFDEEHLLSSLVMFLMLKLNVNLFSKLSVMITWTFLVDYSENFRLYKQDSYDGISTNFNGLFILSFYISSLNKNCGKFTPYIDELIKKPDIIVHSKTWFYETNIDKLPV